MQKTDKANENQKKAITETDGPVLIIAGPGTGKTYTIVKRIAHLVFEKNVAPSAIMAVTFTEKAARELLTRISDEFLKRDPDCGININEMYIGTFHAVCLRLLKEYAPDCDTGNSRMLDAFEQNYLVCRNIEQFRLLGGFRQNITKSGDWNQAGEVCRYVNQLTEELVDERAMEEDSDSDMRFLGRMSRRYHELLEKNKAMDFASIQIRLWRVLQSNKEMREAIREKIRYIMVDEYQDTNYIQEQLALCIAGERKNLCVVGDDDQSLYRFRGATVRNILEFPGHFAENECRIIHLDENYRSEPDIIRFYSRWMENTAGVNLFNIDHYRYEKHIRPAENRTQEDGGAAVYVCGGDSAEEEKKEVLNLIRRLRNQGNITDYNQIAFLFSSVKSSEAEELAEFLESSGIPVYSPRSEMFFERKEIRQILGCLMICFKSYTDDLKEDNFKYQITQELREYYKGCRAEAVQLLRADEGLQSVVRQQITEILSAGDDGDEGLPDIFYRLMAFEPFHGILCENCGKNAARTRAARNLAEVSRMIARFNRLHNMHGITRENRCEIAEQFFNIYLKYLYIDGVGEYEDDAEYAPEGCVSFMTIHQSKGLEFPVVITGSLGRTPRRNRDPLMLTAENRFFHRKPYEPLNEIKYFDFQRLYYVAFSRAQNLLVLATKDADKGWFAGAMRELPDATAYTSEKKFNRIKKISYRRVYSFTSHISVYEGCPKQYKYYKEYGFAQNRMFHTSVGSLVHATLEDMNKCAAAGNTADISEEKIRDWFELNYKTMQETTGYTLTDGQHENAEMQVLAYYRHRKSELHKVWRAEEEINLVLPEYILQGVVDLIEGEGDTVEVVDYKTGPKPDAERHPELVEHYRKQLEIYAYLIEKRTGKKVKRMHLYYTSELAGEPVITFEWSREAVDRTIGEVTATVRNIEEGNFEGEATNAYACAYCDMKHLCKR